MGRPTKDALKNSTAAFAPVAPPQPEQPSHNEPKGIAKATAASPALAAPTTFTVPERQGDRHDSDSGDDDPADDVLLRSPAVRQRYRCSDMWIHRRLTDASGFPRPIYIAGKRHWRLSDLLAWEAAQAKQPVPKPRILEHHEAARAALAQKRAEQKRRQAGAPTSPQI
jgi:predicted DNA-binding transcriptional regulator AlpA